MLFAVPAYAPSLLFLASLILVASQVPALWLLLMPVEGIFIACVLAFAGVLVIAGFPAFTIVPAFAGVSAAAGVLALLGVDTFFLQDFKANKQHIVSLLNKNDNKNHAQAWIYCWREKSDLKQMISRTNKSHLPHFLLFSKPNISIMFSMFQQAVSLTFIQCTDQSVENFAMSQQAVSSPLYSMLRSVC
jgi:hypothetical protein